LCGWGDENALIAVLLASAKRHCKVAELTDEQWETITVASTDADAELIKLRSIFRGAVLYALGYLYEHREKADHHALTLTLRSILLPALKNYFEK